MKSLYSDAWFWTGLLMLSFGIFAVASAGLAILSIVAIVGVLILAWRFFAGKPKSRAT